MGGTSNFAVGFENLGGDFDLLLSPRGVVSECGAHGLCPDKFFSGCPNGVRLDGEPAFMDPGIKGLFCFRVRFPEGEHESLDFSSFRVARDREFNDCKLAFRVR